MFLCLCASLSNENNPFIFMLSNPFSTSLRSWHWSQSLLNSRQILCHWAILLGLMKPFVQTAWLLPSCTPLIVNHCCFLEANVNTVTVHKPPVLLKDPLGFPLGIVSTFQRHFFSVSRTSLATFHEGKHNISHMSMDIARGLMVTCGTDRVVKVSWPVGIPPEIEPSSCCEWASRHF